MPAGPSPRASTTAPPAGAASEPTTEAAEPTTEAAEPTTEAAEPTTEAAEPIFGAAEPTTEAGSFEPGQVVPGNRWDRLRVPEIGDWTPDLRVSLVLPYYQAPDELEITLAAIAEQTYPAELLQVVVADDGSEPPLELPERHRGLDITVVHQEDRGFGLARARNTGAAAADGDVLIFMDCDMVPEPWQVEAHARWHHVCDDAVTLGFRRHVEFDGIGPDEVRDAARAGELAPLFDGRQQDAPAWVEYHMNRSDELTGGQDDLFRMVTGGNIGIRASTYARVGGSDESFTQWGSEDTELGYRLFVDGAVLVPERDALCWHQGAGHTLDADELVSLDEQRAKLSQLVAHFGFRPVARGRNFRVPRVAVEVDGRDATIEQITGTVESVLASELYDLRVDLFLPADLPERVRIERDLGGDPRVRIDDGGPRGPVPLVLHLPAGMVVSPTTIGQLDAIKKERDTSSPVGVVRFAVEDGAMDLHHGVLVRSRALHRAERVRDGRPVLEVAAELFGQRDLGADEVEVTWQERVEPEEVSLDAGGDVAGFEEIQGLWDALRKLDADERTSVLGLAKRLFALSPRQRRLLFRTGARLLALRPLLTRLRRVRAVLRRGRPVVAKVAVTVLPSRTVTRLRRSVYRRADRRRGAS